jgi:stage II sporulation protein R
MKQRILTFYIIGLVLSTAILAAMPTEAEGAIYHDVIRLHILAASDSEEDQRLKIVVRDALLTEFGGELGTYCDRSEAEAGVKALLPAMEEAAKRALSAEGNRDAVEITLSECRYDRRDYGAFTMPSGTYLSLEVRIGEAAGKNWWCVLFPPLCTESAYGEFVYDEDSLPVGLTPEEYRLITGESEGYRVKFKVLEALSEAFG